MEAHDEKISRNRRKLFKALSAAPVIMTLRPGSALATASAFQCLSEDFSQDALAGAIMPASKDQLCTLESQDCYAYVERTYWVVPDSGQSSSPLSRLPPQSRGTPQSRGIPQSDEGPQADPSLCDLAGMRIVETHSPNPDVPGDPSVFVAMDANSSPLPSSVLDGLVIFKNFNGSLDISKVTGDGTQLCYKDIPLARGYFLLLGEKIEENGQPVAFNYTGVYPQQGGQGITQTCLLSVTPGLQSVVVFVRG